MHCKTSMLIDRSYRWGEGRAAEGKREMQAQCYVSASCEGDSAAAGWWKQRSLSDTQNVHPQVLWLDSTCNFRSPKDKLRQKKKIRMESYQKKKHQCCLFENHTSTSSTLLNPTAPLVTSVVSVLKQWREAPNGGKIKKKKKDAFLIWITLLCSSSWIQTRGKPTLHL